MSKNQVIAIILTGIIVTGLWTIIKEFNLLVLLTSIVSATMIFHIAKYFQDNEDTITIPKSALISPEEMKRSKMENKEIGFKKQN